MLKPESGRRIGYEGCLGAAFRAQPVIDRKHAKARRIAARRPLPAHGKMQQRHAVGATRDRKAPVPVMSERREQTLKRLLREIAISHIRKYSAAARRCQRALNSRSAAAPPPPAA
ncbi:MAG: hypothetical protein Kow0032_19170 [Methyloligellaceae bacterium]